MSPACPTSVLKTIFCVKGIDPHIKINVLARARHACAHRRVPPMSPPGGRQSKGVMLERFAGSPGSKARSALPTSHRQTRVVCTSRTRSDRAGCVAASGKREGSSGVPCCDTPLTLSGQRMCTTIWDRTCCAPVGVRTWRTGACFFDPMFLTRSLDKK